ncbi:MAG: hypothetical protein LBO78_00205 [Rickettsiales bacterium]|jgi:hypothetical protein|nr:hypothetical protein [Rickettsiales bacterium]
MDSNPPALKRFSDFCSRPPALAGEKRRISEIIGKEIAITGYQILAGKFATKNCTKVQFQIDGAQFVFFTGSAVLTSQLEEYKSHLPFLATILKINKYFTLT